MSRCESCNYYSMTCISGLEKNCLNWCGPKSQSVRRPLRPGRRIRHAQWKDHLSEPVCVRPWMHNGLQGLWRGQDGLLAPTKTWFLCSMTKHKCILFIRKSLLLLRGCPSPPRSTRFPNAWPTWPTFHPLKTCLNVDLWNPEISEFELRESRRCLSWKIFLISASVRPSFLSTWL